MEKTKDFAHPCMNCGCFYIGEGVLCSVCKKQKLKRRDNPLSMLREIAETFTQFIMGFLGILGMFLG